MSQTLVPEGELIDDIVVDVAPKSYDDVRSCPRVAYRTCAEAVIHPAIHGKGRPSRSFVLTQDLSDGGCNIVHAVQLFPGQRLDIVLGGKTERTAVVAWCQRLPDKHFAIGCRFTNAN